MAYIKMRCRMTDCFGYNTETPNPFCEVMEIPNEVGCPFYKARDEYYKELKELDMGTGTKLPPVEEIREWVIKAEKYSPYCGDDEEALHNIQKFIMGGE